MNELFSASAFLGVFLSLISYFIGVKLRKKWKLAILNPLLVAILFSIAVLLLLNIDYPSYYAGANYLSYLLTPATVCLAIPLYEQFELLKRNWLAVICGIASGVITSLCSILAFAILFRFDHAAYVTFLPKSITTSIGIGVSQELGGYVSVTVSVILISGILGNICAEALCKLLRITDPIAKGIAIGTASHAIGTAKAMELGEIEGAMSSLSIVVSGLLTVLGANLFAYLW